MRTDETNKPKIERFRDAARPRRGDDPERFRGRAAKLVKHKPVEKKG